MSCSRDLPAEHDYGNRVHVSGSEAGDGVCGARAGCDQANPDLPARPRVAVSRVYSGLLVTYQVVADIRTKELVVEIQDRSTRKSEDGVHLFSLQTVNEDLCSGKLLHPCFSFFFLLGTMALLSGVIALPMILRAARQDGSGMCRGDQACVAREVTSRYLGGRRTPFRSSAGLFLLVHLPVKASARDVQRDRVPVVHQPQGSALRGFRGNVTHTGASRSAGESAVCQKDHPFQPHAHDGRRGGQHLPHAGSAFRAFVTNDHCIAFFDVS